MVQTRSQTKKQNEEQRKKHLKQLVEFLYNNSSIGYHLYTSPPPTPTLLGYNDDKEEVKEEEVNEEVFNEEDFYETEEEYIEMCLRELERIKQNLGKKNYSGNFGSYKFKLCKIDTDFDLRYNLQTLLNISKDIFDTNHTKGKLEIAIIIFELLKTDKGKKLIKLYQHFRKVVEYKLHEFYKQGYKQFYKTYRDIFGVRIPL